MKHLAHTFMFLSLFVVVGFLGLNHAMSNDASLLTGMVLLEPDYFYDHSQDWVFPEDGRATLTATDLGDGVFEANLHLEADGHVVWRDAYYLTKDGWTPLSFYVPIQDDWLTGSLNARIRDFKVRLPTEEVAAEALRMPGYAEDSLIVITYWCDEVENGMCACENDPDCSYWVLSSVKV